MAAASAPEIKGLEELAAELESDGLLQQQPEQDRGRVLRQSRTIGDSGDQRISCKSRVGS